MIGQEWDDKNDTRPPTGRAVFRALSMRPDERSWRGGEETTTTGTQGPQVTVVAPGAAVSSFSGPNFTREPERATFLGGALICLTFAGLRSSRIGRREVELPGRESVVALLSPEPVEVASIAAPQPTRETVAAFVSMPALERFGVDLMPIGRRRGEVVRHCRMTPAARGLASGVLRRDASSQVRRLRSEALVLELLAELQEETEESSRHGHDTPRGPTLASIHRARDAIAADPTADHSLVSIAAAAGVSVTTLKRDFPKTFGTSPIAFLRTQRLELGRAMIEFDGLSVSSAAYACGYGHPGNFAQAFRRHFGFSPSDLRR